MSDRQRRRTAILALLSAGTFWIATAAVGLANQASFFSMGEYLQSPMWTARVPWYIGLPFTLSAVILGLSSLILLAVSGVALVLLTTRAATSILCRAASVVFIVLAMNVLIYQALATVGYLIARGSLPARFAESFAVFAVAAVVMCFLAACVWMSGRLRPSPPTAVA